MKLYFITILVSLYSNGDFQPLNNEINNNYDNQFEFEILNYPRPTDSNSNDFFYYYDTVDGDRYDGKDYFKEDENIDNDSIIKDNLKNNFIYPSQNNLNTNNDDVYFDFQNDLDQKTIDPVDNKRVMDYFYSLNEPNPLFKELKDDIQYLFNNRKNQQNNEVNKNTNDQNALNVNELLNVNSTTKSLLLTIISTNSTPDHTKIPSNDNNNNNTSYLLQEYAILPNNRNVTRTTTNTLKDILTSSTKSNHADNINSTQYIPLNSSTTTPLPLAPTTITSTTAKSTTTAKAKKENDPKDLEAFSDYYDIDPSNVDSLLSKSKTFQLVDKRKNNGRSSSSSVQAQNGR